MGLTETSNSSTSTLEDDELTNLTWLQDNNLLQNMTQDNDCTTSENNSKIFLKEDNENVSPKSLVINNNNIKKVDLENNQITTSCGTTIPCSVPPIRYNPLLHVHTKPPYSFSSLIFMAIESSPHKALPVKEIYNWIVQNFPFYQDAPEGWKNTVRHNLSLNKCFQKIEKGKKFKGANGHENKLINDQLASKGSLWCIDPLLRPNLLQAIKKTPAHIYPYMSTAKTSTNLVQIGNIINSTNDNLNSNVVNQSSNFDLNNIAVSIGNNISSVALGNNFTQTSKKIISLEKLPEKNILTTTKRVLIPIAKVGREPEEADAAESMLTLTQCSTTGSLNNGNIYIITNKKENFLPIQINSSSFVSNTINNKAQNNKNQITAILSQPVVQSPQKTQSTQNSTTVTSISTSQFNTSTDHNYFSRSSISTCTKTVNASLVTATAIPVGSITGQAKVIVNNNSNLIPVSNLNTKLSTNKIITISTINGLKKDMNSNSSQDTSITNSDQNNEKKTNKKEKVDEDNDEDGLKCAEALFNLANGSTVKLNSTSSKNLKVKKESKDDQINLNSKKQIAKNIITVETISSSTNSNKSNLKKLKTS